MGYKKDQKRASENTHLNSRGGHQLRIPKVYFPGLMGAAGDGDGTGPRDGTGALWGRLGDKRGRHGVRRQYGAAREPMPRGRHRDGTGAGRARYGTATLLTKESLENERT